MTKAKNNEIGLSEAELEELRQAADNQHGYEAQRRHFWKVATPVFVVVAVLSVAGLVVWLSSVLDTPPDIEPKFPGEGAAEGTVTISAPIRAEGSGPWRDPNSSIYSDSILITLSKSLADEGWMPLLSDGSCKVLSPGANTSFTGADGVQVTSFDQTTATHIILAQDADDLDCDLEYAVPSLRGAAGTFTTTVTPGE